MIGRFQFLSVYISCLMLLIHKCLIHISHLASSSLSLVFFNALFNSQFKTAQYPMTRQVAGMVRKHPSVNGLSLLLLIKDSISPSVVSLGKEAFAVAVEGHSSKSIY